MKKIILGLAIILSLISCTKSPENKAKENAEKYITAKMDDPKSYESVSFGVLEKAKSSYQDEEKYKNLLLEYIDIDKKVTDAFDLTMSMTHENTIKSSTKIYENLLTIEKSVLNEIEQYKKDYKPVDIYKIKHSFRGKNKIGTLILDSCKVVFDNNLEVKFVQ